MHIHVHVYLHLLYIHLHLHACFLQPSPVGTLPQASPSLQAQPSTIVSGDGMYIRIPNVRKDLVNKPVPDERNNAGKGSVMVASRCVVHVLQNDPAPCTESTSVYGAVFTQCLSCFHVYNY